MLRRQDVGHRVVVRRIVGVRDDRQVFTDALGELVDLTETHLTLATDRGKLQVPLAEVHRAKRVPPARRPNATAVVDLELAANEAWPAPVQDRLGGWLLRSADGWTGRGNSALPIGDPDRPLEAAIDAVERWYADRGQPAIVNTPLPLAAPVGVALDERGWTTRPPTLMQTAPLATVRGRTPDRTDLPPVELAATPSDGWLALAAARKAAHAGRTVGADPLDSLPAAARHLLTAVDQVRFAHLYGPSGALLAAGRGTVTGAGRWLGLMSIEVVPEARRQGLAQHVVRALVDWAAALGATDVFLQVEERNTAAVALYRRLGFTTHHTYLTRVQPTG
ncbi:GNAT family N-acetyltransferase [Micromonospora sp. NBC_01796]|uniref:GNAT family N-acetyltransferase n=1 Tax=Micromonospora sp. NBC_01796 TaxID=2975987 RepID=UPI002DDC2FFC|nr:GNAT family N-acetyltransferase [Micromonospora sp. NBC_01796]WSA89344.1 GNAT family N-acetyltransferase [Micromonospora sp. NBC_01796]